ncbi:MAG: cob(I)yrinic acid a,c-diamide adenosyltransferase, partial [Candidatus Bathyarchaeota archaeon]|nr:cob(I)yrinic acid a,c-diamide adenosyltransferase [Candidatus Bathyarchaeota archaeon]
MGYIYLYTGTGGGKTANALGLALRSVGHRRRVVLIQFLKWWKNTGEY